MERLRGICSLIEERPSWVALALIAMGSWLIWLVLGEVKGTQNVLINMWNEYREKAFFMENLPSKSLGQASSASVKRVLDKNGLEVEAIEDTALGVEIQAELEWPVMASMMKVLEQQGFQVQGLQAEDVNGKGRFRLRMTLQ